MNTPKVMALSEIMGSSWVQALYDEFEKPYFFELEKKIIAAKNSGDVILPKKEDIFRAFRLTPPHRVKVVLVGQDPYPHQHAHGLCFSTLDTKIPASLQNIFKELLDDVDETSGNDLSSWAGQGVLMLNAVLTVSEGKANSHQGFGWEKFTLAALNHIYGLPNPKVWILWGSYAQNLYEQVCNLNAKIHPGYIPPHPALVLKSVHPSPLSAHKGFFGSKPFSQTNEFLEKNGLIPIYWDMPF